MPKKLNASLEVAGAWGKFAHEVAKIIGHLLATREVRLLKAAVRESRKYIRSDESLTKAKKPEKIKRLKKLKIHYKKRFRKYAD